jgi:hypothetical protein
MSPTRRLFQNIHIKEGIFAVAYQTAKENDNPRPAATTQLLPKKGVRNSGNRMD